jgi:dihydroorotate dehydrogenase (NAD+) catalytic subunit
MAEKEMNLSVKIGALVLKNPVMVASGTFGYGGEYSSLIDINMLGAVVTKGISLEPSPGNPPPRIVETPSGMLNAIGLQNVGFQSFVTDKMPLLREYDTAVIVNFYGSKIEDYVELAAKLSSVEGVDALEANISCPNIKEGGITFGTDPEMAYEVTEKVRAVTDKPLIVKLTPNVTDISAVAKRVEDAGADAVSLTNTFAGMVIDIDACRPAIANITGGLSGPAIRPLSLRMVWETVKAVTIPVIGIGGIIGSSDALQFLICGACAVQVGTGLFVDPKTPISIINGIQNYLTDKDLTDINDVIGSLKTDNM